MRSRKKDLQLCVIDSNLIGGIQAEKDDPLFYGHMGAMKIASKGKIVHPDELHHILVKDVILLRRPSVKYRTWGEVVGKRRKPHHSHVAALMDEWYDLLQKSLAVESLEDFASLAEYLHFWLMCIYPYPCGNGRTARLVWNMLRRNKELRLIVVGHDNSRKYYARLRTFEDKVFKEAMYPYVYEEAPL